MLNDAVISDHVCGVQVMVKMRNLDNGNEWLLDRNKFINRKYLMQEMYQNFMEGDKDWDVPKVFILFSFLSNSYQNCLPFCLCFRKKVINSNNRGRNSTSININYCANQSMKEEGSVFSSNNNKNKNKHF